MTEKLAPRSAREPQGTAVGSGSLSTLFLPPWAHTCSPCGGGEPYFRFFLLIQHV